MKTIEHKTEIITLSIEEYKRNLWEGHELTFEGKLYDVIATSFHNDTVSLRVIYDKSEESLIQKVKEFFHGHRRSSGKLPKYMQKLMTSKYIPPAGEMLTELVFSTSSGFTYLLSSFVDIAKEIPSPPPW